MYFEGLVWPNPAAAAIRTKTIVRKLARGKLIFIGTANAGAEVGASPRFYSFFSFFNLANRLSAYRY